MILGHIHHANPRPPTACAADAVRPTPAGVTGFVILRGMTIRGAYFARIQPGKPRIVSSSAWISSARMEMVSSSQGFSLLGHSDSGPNSRMYRKHRRLRSRHPLSRRQLLLRHRDCGEHLLRTRQGSLHRQGWSNHNRQSIIVVVTEYSDIINNLYNPDDILNRSCEHRRRRLTNSHGPLGRRDQTHGKNHE